MWSGVQRAPAEPLPYLPGAIHSELGVSLLLVRALEVLSLHFDQAVVVALPEIDGGIGADPEAATDRDQPPSDQPLERMPGFASFLHRAVQRVEVVQPVTQRD